MMAIRFANAVFLVGALFQGLIAAYVLFNRQQFLDSPLRSAIFLGLPLACVAGCLLALRLRPSWRISAAMTLVSAAAAVYGAEAFLSFRPEARPGLGGIHDPRTRQQVVADLRRAGTPAYPGVFPKYLLRTGSDLKQHSPLRLGGREVLPLGGIGGVVTVLCNESGAHVTYRADRHGFRNPDVLWQAVPAKVLVLGDSFAQGYCVPDGEDMAGRIRETFPATLNLGMSGNGPLGELAGLREYGPLLKPEFVVWFFFEGNDLPGDLAIEVKSPLLLDYLEDGTPQGLQDLRAEIDRVLAAHVDELLEQAGGRDFNTDAGLLQATIGFAGLTKVRSALDFRANAPEPDYATFQRILEAARDTAAALGGRMVFVYLPDWSATIPGEDDPKTRALHDRVMATASVLGLATVDVRQAFKDHPDPKSLFPFRQPGHYGASGHALVARRVTEVLQRLDRSPSP